MGTTSIIVGLEIPVALAIPEFGKAGKLSGVIPLFIFRGRT